MTIVTDDKKRAKPLGIKLGIVISDCRDKTRTVEVVHLAKHRKYGKYLRHRSKYQVHDACNESRIGDRVQIANCRPLSKTKSWRLVCVVVKAEGAVHQSVEAPRDRGTDQ